MDEKRLEDIESYIKMKIDRIAFSTYDLPEERKIISKKTFDKKKQEKIGGKKYLKNKKKNKKSRIR